MFWPFLIGNEEKQQFRQTSARRTKKKKKKRRFKNWSTECRVELQQKSYKNILPPKCHVSHQFDTLLQCECTKQLRKDTMNTLSDSVNQQCGNNKVKSLPLLV